MTTDMYAQGPPRRVEQIVPLVRKTFGDKMALYAAPDSFYSVLGAIRVGRLLEQYNYRYFQEPVLFDHLEGNERRRRHAHASNSERRAGLWLLR